MLEQQILEYIQTFIKGLLSPFCKRKDRRLQFTHPPILLVDHCENFELLFSQAP
jgi:hypothetical protein